MMHEFYMDIAFEYARKAFMLGEVPVGAVLVKNNEIISCGYNLRETCNNALSHAEITAIYEGCKRESSWRLSDCAIYVTLQPCPMCIGAIFNARIKTLVYGANDTKYGISSQIIDVMNYNYNHHLNVIPNILEADCSYIIKKFFKELRY